MFFVKLLLGKGYKKKWYVDFEKLLKKKIFIKIINRDYLWCVRVIVMVKVRIDK